MTDNTQPEALRLADQLRALSFGGTCILAAAELRRQHARIVDLEQQMAAIGAGGVEPLRSRQCLHKISEPSGWRPIETAPVGKEMFVARAIDVLNGFTGGRTYTSDPWCVWQPEKGKFSRWNHHFQPTHWMPLPSPSSADEGGSND